MAIDYASGRIYHEEFDLSFFIEGLGRTITGFVGSASWGPMNVPTDLRDEDDFKDQFGPPVTDSNSYMCARSYFQRGNSLSMIRVGDGSEAKSSGTPTVSAGTPPTYRAKYPGTRGDDLEVVITQGTSGSGFYKITLLDGTEEADVFDNIPDDIETDLQPFLARSDLIEGVVGVGAGTVDVPQTVPLTGGDDGLTTIDEDDYVGTSTGSGKTGLQLMKAPGEVDADFVLCPNAQGLTAKVWQEMIDIAEVRQDLLSILDSPSGFTVNSDSGGGPYGIDQFWRGTSNHAETLNVNSSFAATYWNWITIHDYFNGVDVSIPPGSAAAGALNYSDRIAYPWWAAAGINRASLSPLVKETEYQPLDEEITILQSDKDMGCVNPILLIGDQYAVMGQKTLLRTNSMLNRINTRRLVNKTKKALLARLSILQDEPNDETTWRQFPELIKPHLDYLVKTRGLIDYEIQVGLDISMTKDDVAAGRLIGRVILVLMPTAEKVVIGYVITDQSANFAELAA